jgi:hypothetical protein
MLTDVGGEKPPTVSLMHNIVGTSNGGGKRPLTLLYLRGIVEAEKRSIETINMSISCTY